MKKPMIAIMACLALAAWLQPMPQAGQETMLQVGEPAPDFALPGSDGKIYSLADFRGKEAVVIAWFPKAFTGG